MFEKLRTYLGKQASIQDEYTPIRQSIAEMFACPYCLGVWVAGIVYIFRKPLKPIIYIFMLAGLQNMYQGIDDKLGG